MATDLMAAAQECALRVYNTEILLERGKNPGITHVGMIDDRDFLEKLFRSTADQTNQAEAIGVKISELRTAQEQFADTRSSEAIRGAIVIKAATRGLRVLQPAD